MYDDLGSVGSGEKGEEGAASDDSTYRAILVSQSQLSEDLTA